jgi:hypothetical protein
VGGIAIGTEADFPTGKTLEGTERRVVSGFPRIPNLQWGLALIHVARALNPEHPVNFVATMSAVAADDSIKSGFNGCDGVLRFAEDPYLNHIAGFPVVRSFGESRGDYDTDGIFVENEAVQLAPPWITVKRTLWPVVSFRPDGYPINAANSTIERFLV